MSRIRALTLASLACAVGLLALSAAPAFAAPEVPLTETPTTVTATTAAFTGELNPGSATERLEYRFEYKAASACELGGTDAPLESPFPEAEGNHTQVSVPVAGLLPGTEYAVCLEARGLGEFSWSGVGPAVTFKTLTSSAPLIVAERTQEGSVTPHAAALEAEVNSEDEPGTYAFEYAGEEALIGTSSATSIEGALSPASTNQTLGPVDVGGLEPNKTYYYRIVATNGVGPAEGQIEHFTTQTLKIPGIEEESSGPVGQSTASLTALINPEFQPVTLCEFQISGGVPPAPCAPSAALELGEAGIGVSTGANLTGLTANTEYQYKVLAENATGQAEGAEQTFLTLPTPPAAATGGAIGATTRSVSLTGIVDPENTGQPSQDETTYYFQYGHTPLYGAQIPRTPGDAGEGESPILETASLSELEPGSSYDYRIVAVNGPTGNPQITYGQNETFATTAIPPILSAISVGGVTQTTATVAATLDPQGLSTRYELQVGAIPGALQPVTSGETSTATPLSLTVGSLTPGTIYSFKLIADSSNGTIESEGSFTTTPATAASPPPGLPALILFRPMSEITLKEAQENKTNSNIRPPLTKLQKALKACHKDKKRAKRAKCEKHAHTKYAPKKSTATKPSQKTS